MLRPRCASVHRAKRSGRNVSDIRALLAKIASRIKELVRRWRKATVARYASPTHPWRSLGFDGKAMIDMRNRSWKLHCGATPLVGWSDAAFGDESTVGRCLRGYSIGLTSSSVTGPRHALRRAPEFTRKLVQSSPGGEVCALSVLADRLSLLGDFDAPGEVLAPGMVGLRKSVHQPGDGGDDCRKAPRIQQSLEQG